MLELRHLGDIAWADAAGGRRHVSAASGLLRAGETLLIVADDELALARLDPAGTSPARSLPLLPGRLPKRTAARKAAKPDFESLVLLPPVRDWPLGAVLVLGSGSTPRRMRGALLPLSASASVGAARQVDLGPLYRPLAMTIPKLNIEGAAVCGDRLLLFQRGNSIEGRNAVAGFDLAAAMAALVSGSEVAPVSIADVDLGSVDGVPLCFTDASPLPDGRVVFSAVAEDTDDPYLDGACMGSAVGILDRHLAVERIVPLEGKPKVEGVDARLTEGGIELLLVTDADDPARPSRLLAATLSA